MTESERINATAAAFYALSLEEREALRREVYAETTGLADSPSQDD